MPGSVGRRHDAIDAARASLNHRAPVTRCAGTARTEAALRLVDALALDHYYLWHAIRADLLRRLRRTTDAASAYAAAMASTDNATERAFLQRRYEASGGN